MNLTMTMIMMILNDPLSKHNWLSQTRRRFMKYVIYNLSDSTESKPISNQKQSFKKGIKKGRNCLSYTQG